MESADSVLYRLKDFITIKELSECLNVSRPTIYNYVRAYEEHRMEKLPEIVVKLFDTVANGTDEELESLIKDIRSKVFPTGKVSSYDLSGLRSGRDDKVIDDVRTISLQDGSKFMVIFYKTPDTVETVLNLFVRDMGNYFCIGQYRPEPDRNFIIIDDIVLTVDYYYEIEQKCVDSLHKSAFNPLRDESAELK